MSSVSIEGLSKAEVLAALYNAAKPLGMGFLHYTPEQMTEAQASAVLASCKQDRLYFDYLDGRVMKVDLTNGGFFESALYDRDNGPGAAEQVINELRKG